MSIGRSVRTRLGKYEAPVSDLYRRQFIDLDACARSRFSGDPLIEAVRVPPRRNNLMLVCERAP